MVWLATHYCNRQADRHTHTSRDIQTGLIPREKLSNYKMPRLTNTLPSISNAKKTKNTVHLYLCADHGCRTSRWTINDSNPRNQRSWSSRHLEYTLFFVLPFPTSFVFYFIHELKAIAMQTAKYALYKVLFQLTVCTFSMCYVKNISL